MNLHTEQRRLVGVSALAAVVACGVASLYAAHRVSDYRAFATQSVRDSVAGFIRTAEQADRTEPTTESKKQIIDCVARDEFDALLSKLDSLTPTERTRLSVLYSDCSDYFWRLKMFYIDRLVSYRDSYVLHATHLGYFIKPDEHLTLTQTIMDRIIESETKRADAMAEQVVFQANVIDDIKKGVLDTAKTMERSGDINYRLGVINASIDADRDALVNAQKGS